MDWPGSIWPAAVSCSAKRQAEALASELARLAPAETLVSEDVAWPDFVTELPGLRKRAPWHFDTQTATRQLMYFFGTRDLSGFGCAEMPLAVAAAGVSSVMSRKHRNRHCRTLTDSPSKMPARRLRWMPRRGAISSSTRIRAAATSTRCSAFSTARSRQWVRARYGAGCIVPCAIMSCCAAATRRSRPDRRPPLRQHARNPARHRRYRTHPGARRSALGAAARSVDAARRPARGAGPRAPHCTRPTARCCASCSTVSASTPRRRRNLPRRCSSSRRRCCATAA